MLVYKDLISLKDIAAIVKDSKDKGVTSAAGTAYHSGTHQVRP